MQTPIQIERVKRTKAHRVELLAVSAEDVNFPNVLEVHAAVAKDVDTLCGEPTMEFTAAWFDPSHPKACQLCAKIALAKAVS